MTQQTQAKAKKQGLYLEVDTEVRIVEIYVLDHDGEPWEEFLASYTTNTDGSLSYRGSCFPGDHDMPAWIENERALQGLLAGFAMLAATME